MSGDLRIDTHDSRVQARGVSGTTTVDTHDGLLDLEGPRGAVEVWVSTQNAAFDLRLE